MTLFESASSERRRRFFPRSVDFVRYRAVRDKQIEAGALAWTQDQVEVRPSLIATETALLAQQTAPREDRTFALALPNSRAAAVDARKRLIGFIAQFCTNRAILADIETAAGEALANAAEHGFRPNGTISVAAIVHDWCIEASVSDDGPGFTAGPCLLDVPQPLAPRGYGLFMIQSVVDVLESRDGGRTVWFRKRRGGC